MAKKLLVDKFDPIIDEEGPFLTIQPRQQQQQQQRVIRIEEAGE